MRAVDLDGFFGLHPALAPLHDVWRAQHLAVVHACGGPDESRSHFRAMELIAQMEPHARGAYCGSLGYLGWHGAMDLNILIRTMTAAGSWWQFPVGGGIVAQSDPRQEYEETWDKAEGILQAIEAAKSAAGPDR